MSNVLKSIYNFIHFVREANHAATLARNGKTQEAQAHYK